MIAGSSEPGGIGRSVPRRPIPHLESFLTDK
jgi:hypothetical protein